MDKWRKRERMERIRKFVKKKIKKKKKKDRKKYLKKFLGYDRGEILVLTSIVINLAPNAKSADQIC